MIGELALYYTLKQSWIIYRAFGVNITEYRTHHLTIGLTEERGSPIEWDIVLLRMLKGNLKDGALKGQNIIKSKGLRFQERQIAKT